MIFVDFGAWSLLLFLQLTSNNKFFFNTIGKITYLSRIVLFMMSVPVISDKAVFDAAFFFSYLLPLPVCIGVSPENY
jgi:hypothetical protein